MYFKFNNKIKAFLVLSVCVFGAPAHADESGNERLSQVIYDYDLNVDSMRVQASGREVLGSRVPVDLYLEGSVQTGWRTRRISGAVAGISLPFPGVPDAQEYVMLVRDGDVVYTEPYGQAIARVNAEGQLIPEPRWAWRVTYREYRYSLSDRVLGLILGFHPENEEMIFVELDPQ